MLQVLSLRMPRIDQQRTGRADCCRQAVGAVAGEGGCAELLEQRLLRGGDFEVPVGDGGRA